MFDLRLPWSSTQRNKRHSVAVPSSTTTVYLNNNKSDGDNNDEEDKLNDNPLFLHALASNNQRQQLPALSNQRKHHQLQLQQHQQQVAEQQFREFLDSCSRSAAAARATRNVNSNGVSCVQGHILRITNGHVATANGGGPPAATMTKAMSMAVALNGLNGVGGRSAGGVGLKGLSR